jgi:NADP-dependent 3-hydroxy acid dehydrogenase YdfG
MGRAMGTEGRLAGRVAVVTGASSGIGAATAKALAAAGARVVVGARRAERLASVVREIEAAGGAALAVVTDLRDPAQVTRLVDSAVERFGQLDILVNNAAVGVLGLVENQTVQDWRAILDTNVLAVIVASQAALRHMLPRGSGDILTVSSATTNSGWPYFAAYAASKAAVDAFARSLRAEVVGRGLRVTSINVHNTSTEFATGFDPQLLITALGRWAQLGLFNQEAASIDPSVVADAIVFQLGQPVEASIHELTIRARAN